MCVDEGSLTCYVQFVSMICGVAWATACTAVTILGFAHVLQKHEYKISCIKSPQRKMEPKGAF